MKIAKIQPTMIRVNNQQKVNNVRRFTTTPEQEPVAPSFKGSGKGGFAGFVTGFTGALVVLGATAITGGAALPLFVAGGAMLGAGAAGAAIGDKIEDKINEKKNK